MTRSSGALSARQVRFTESVEQSKAIDRIRNFYIVIAASGMCEAGRIRHHLKAWLWRDEATLLLVPRHRGFDWLDVCVQDGQVLWRNQNLDAARDTGLAADEASAFEGENHLVD